MAGIKKIVFIALGIVVVVGFIGFLYYRDTIFSKEILKLEILGSSTANAGDEITYTVKYKNNGNFVLEQPKLVFELPDHSLTEDGKTRISQNLQDIYPGAENVITVKGRLLGKEGDLKIAHAWLSYVPHNLSARYESDTTFTTTIDTVPVTLAYDIPSKVEKGKEISYQINYFSNIDYPLENLSIKLDPVQGFTFESADPKSLDNVEWKLPSLQKGNGGRITITGIVTADTGSHVTFAAHLGMWQDGTFVVIKDVTQDVEVIQPQLFISQQVNGSSDYVASPGETLHYEISVRNIGSTPFKNLFVVSRLDGNAFDLSSLQSPDGQPRVSDSLIAFDPKQVADLQDVEPQQEATLTFSVRLKNSFTIPDDQKNNVSVTNTVQAADISEVFATQINSKLSLSQTGYYSSQQGIQNSGPIPPQVGSATTYTIVWQLKNLFDDASNIKVRAVLPPNVSLTSQVSPASQLSNVSFDNVSREMVWSVGSLPATQSASLAFQVSLLPADPQRGTVATLIGQASVFGEDRTTGATIKTTVSGVNTSLPDDSANSGGGIIQ